jgi:hypothetical protein
VKRSKTGLVLIILGLVTMIALAPLAKWVLAPALVKLPDTINATSIYEGVLNLNVDPNSMAPLPPDMTVKVPVTITRVDVSDKAKSSGGVAVIKETAVAKGPSGKEFVNYTKYFALDRKTCKNVTSDEADVKNRTDYAITLGFFVDQNGEYAIWDDDTMTAGPVKFIKTDTRSGYSYKDVPVQIWEGSGENKAVNPPSGFPKSISGAQVKSIVPSLTTLNDTQMYPIDYIKRTTATFAVDPKTGQFVDVAPYKDEWFIDASALGQGKIPLYTLAYAQTPDNVKISVDDSAKNHKQLDAITIYVPVALLIIGLIELIIGLILYLRKKPA